MSDIYDIKDLLEGKFLITFGIINRYQQKEYVLTAKLNGSSCKIISLCGCGKTIKLVIYKDKHLFHTK